MYLGSNGYGSYGYEAKLRQGICAYYYAEIYKGNKALGECELRRKL